MGMKERGFRTGGAGDFEADGEGADTDAGVVSVGVLGAATVELLGAATVELLDTAAVELLGAPCLRSMLLSTAIPPVAPVAAMRAAASCSVAQVTTVPGLLTRGRAKH
jgi:hypothetical protein